MLEVMCPICRQSVKFAEQAIGKSIRCFSCDTRFMVEQAGSEKCRAGDVLASDPAAEWIESSGGEKVSSVRSDHARLDKMLIATKIIAIAACIVAICVVVSTIFHFTPKSESDDEKMARYRKVCDDYERAVAVKFRIDEQRAAAKPKTFAEEQELYARLYREAGVDAHDVDRLFAEKVALARELGIQEAK